MRVNDIIRYVIIFLALFVPILGFYFLHQTFFGLLLHLTNPTNIIATISLQAASFILSLVITCILVPIAGLSVSICYHFISSKLGFRSSISAKTAYNNIIAVQHDEFGWEALRDAMSIDAGTDPHATALAIIQSRLTESVRPDAVWLNVSVTEISVLMMEPNSMACLPTVLVSPEDADDEVEFNYSEFLESYYKPKSGPFSVALSELCDI